jgi:hypothetical protein
MSSDQSRRSAQARCPVRAYPSEKREPLPLLTAQYHRRCFFSRRNRSPTMKSPQSSPAHKIHSFFIALTSFSRIYVSTIINGSSLITGTFYIGRNERIPVAFKLVSLPVKTRG